MKNIGVPLVKGGQNLPPMVGIGLTGLPNVDFLTAFYFIKPVDFNAEIPVLNRSLCHIMNFKLHEIES